MIDVSETPQNIALAFEIGLKVPETLFFGSFDDDKKKEVFMSGEWDVVAPNLALAHKGDFELTCSAFWDGNKFSLWMLSFKDRYLLSGSQGGKLPENCLTIYPGKIIQLKKQFKLLSARDPEYRGFINIDITPVNGKLYYKKIWFGAHWDFLHCLSELYEKPLDALFKTERIDDIPVEGFACSTRLYAIPYDAIENKIAVEGFKEGEDCWIAVGRGKNIKETWHELYKSVTGINKLGLCYRIDGDVMARRTFAYLKKEKYI